MRSSALPRHDRLGHAQLVDAIAQRGDVLLDREILPLLEPLRREADVRTVCSPPVSFVIVMPGSFAWIGCARGRDVGARRAASRAPSPPSTRAFVYGMRSSRSCVRMSCASRCSAWSIAPSTSTSYMKCTPPRRSRPRLIGFRPSLRRNAGVRGTLVSATMYSPGVASLIASRALIWSSTCAKRRIRRPSSRYEAVGVIFCASSTPDDALLSRRVDRGAIVARELDRGFIAEQIGQREQQRGRQHDADEPISPGRNLVHADGGREIRRS